MLQLPDDPFVTIELAHDPARPVTETGGLNHLIRRVLMHQRRNGLT